MRCRCGAALLAERGARGAQRHPRQSAVQRRAGGSGPGQSRGRRPCCHRGAASRVSAVRCCLQPASSVFLIDAFAFAFEGVNFPLRCRGHNPTFEPRAGTSLALRAGVPCPRLSTGAVAAHGVLQQRCLCRGGWVLGGAGRGFRVAVLSQPKQRVSPLWHLRPCQTRVPVGSQLRSLSESVNRGWSHGRARLPQRTSSTGSPCADSDSAALQR